MLREIAHFLRHLPSNRRMRRTMNQADFYDALARASGVSPPMD